MIDEILSKWALLIYFYPPLFQRRSHPGQYEDLKKMKNRVEMLEKCTQLATQHEDKGERINSRWVDQPEHEANRALEGIMVSF